MYVYDQWFNSGCYSINYRSRERMLIISYRVSWPVCPALSTRDNWARHTNQLSYSALQSEPQLLPATAGISQVWNSHKLSTSCRFHLQTVLWETLISFIYLLYRSRVGSIHVTKCYSLIGPCQISGCFHDMMGHIKLSTIVSFLTSTFP